MSSYAQAKSGAERQREYYARKKESGAKPRGKSGKNISKWQRADFIALDGEGESIGEMQTFKVGKDGKNYKAKEHRYTLLAASSGENLYAGGERLKTQDCIDWLLNLGAEHRQSIFVIFAGSYDINHILMFGFEREVLQKISRGETYEYEFSGEKYSLEYRARKSLQLRRGLTFVANKKGEWKPRWRDKIIIWDVFGFFQENFVAVMGKWIGKDWKHYDLIKDMKARRGDFANVPQAQINAYNAAELETLKALMERVHEAISKLDLKCTRWDGAGAVAAAMLRKHGIAEFKDETSEEIIEAVRTAYAGGRIEVCKIGSINAPVYDYDINSAYPFVTLDLPCLAHGFWKNGKGEPPPGFTLVYCEYDFELDQQFYPLFFRTSKMQIMFPAEGRGWYWYPEYKAAQLCMGNLKPLKWFHFETCCDHKPFSFVPEYYNTRQQWVKKPTEHWHGGAEKIIKLGLNSTYGKTAQQQGGQKNRPPTYHQMEWAGYITSATRARLYVAGMLDPDAVIGFATDGIFTTRKLNLELSTSKKLGCWNVEEFLGMTIAQAGVYWWHLNNASPSADQNATGDAMRYGHFSRGFDKDSMKTPERIMQAWQRGESQIDISMHRLIGMGSACASHDLWKMRGRFTEGFRTLRLDGRSNKRDAIDVIKAKPHAHLVDLKPAVNVEYGFGIQDCSFPYPVQWLDANKDEDYEKELELAKENSDTENI